MPRPARQPKRPYVRPRIGYSIGRSLWYAAAFFALLAVAFLMPRTSAPPPSVEGDWLLETAVPVGSLPAGESALVLHGGHYTLRSEVADGTVRVEFGAAVVADGQVILEPVEAIEVNDRGGGRRAVPSPHSFRVRYRGDSLVLEAEGGASVTGRRQPFVPTATGTGGEPR